MRGHVSLFVILLWLAAVLLMSRNTPWVDLPSSLSNGTSSSNQSSFPNETSLSDESTTPSNEMPLSDESNETSYTPEMSFDDETTFSNVTDGTKWQPPIFGLDNIHLWPIQVTL